MNFILMVFNLIWGVITWPYRKLFPKKPAEIIDIVPLLRKFDIEPEEYTEDAVVLPIGTQELLGDKSVDIVDIPDTKEPEVVQDHVEIQEMSFIEVMPTEEIETQEIQVVEEVKSEIKPLFSFMGGMDSSTGLNGASFIVNNRISSIRMGSKFY